MTDNTKARELTPEFAASRRRFTVTLLLFGVPVAVAAQLGVFN